MLQFRCVDVGADCKGHFTAETSEDLVKQVSEHLQIVHRVRTPTQTIMKYFTRMATEAPAPPIDATSRQD